MALFRFPFRPEPSASPPTTAAVPIGILWCNLGTPDAPNASALRRYLGQFLSDPRIIEIPMALWRPILHGIILRTRPAKSAAKYASIWTPEGSPLRVWTEKQAKLLQGWLGERGHRVVVRHAMRYGQPDIGAQLDAFKAQGIQRVLLLQAYPQYSGTTTASVLDAVFDWGKQVRVLPELRCVNRYANDPGYIDALARSVRAHWATHGRIDAPGSQARLLLSFHGIPERAVNLGDPYREDCTATARLLRERLGLPEALVQVSFQSRLGRAKWLEPYTEPTAQALAAQGVQRLDVLCPGFTADCLETLEEINMEVRAAFQQAGGQSFHYIPCLNDNPAWIDALGQLAVRHLGGWES